MATSEEKTIQFNSIYEVHNNLVYNLSLSYLHNQEEAQEATQDVFVKIYAKLNEFRGDSQLKTWIYRITINICLDRIKSNKRKKWMGMLQLLPNQIDNSSTILHPGIQLEQREATENILKLIRRLPTKQQSALILKSIEGLNQKEIAEIMSTSEKAVESLLSRARKKLRELINNEGL